MDNLPPFQSRMLAVCGPVAGSGAGGPGHTCRSLFSREPDVERVGRERGLAVCADGAATWATEPSGRVTVVLHGEVLGLGQHPAESLAMGFAREGLGHARELDGHFALLVHDAALERTWAVTDRANGRWLFHALVDGHHVLTTELAAQPTRSFTLDPVGIGWALSAGMAVLGRTLYRELRILEGGSTHALGTGAVESKPYWSYTIGDRTAGRSPERLEDDLYALLVEAVRRNVADISDPVLSLSVGYDLTAVAGILVRELGFRDIEAFSYAKGAPTEGSDARAAGQLADLLGLRHRIVESYGGDLIEHIRRNALLGGGLGNPCEEVDAWCRLGADFAGGPAPVVLTGDQRFGGRAVAFHSPEEVRWTVGLRPLRLPSQVGQHMARDQVRAIEEGQEADWQAVWASAPQFDHFNDLHDYLRWTQRLRHRIMPWRDRFAARFSRVRMPWLDRRIVDFVAGLPVELRMGKLLYKRTVSKRLPDLYGFPRASVGGYELDLSHEIRNQSDRLRETVLAGTSRLDEVIPPDAVLAALLAAGGRPSGLREGGAVAVGHGHRLIQRVRRRLGERDAVLPPRLLQLQLRRLAVLREALR